MKPPINYYGGKSRIADWIVGYLPRHRVYVEPFFGSGAVLFAKPPSTHEVVNDVDGNVVNFFRMLRDRPEDLVRVCRLTPYARDEFEAAVLIDGGDELERARRFFVRICQGFGKSLGTRGADGVRSVGWSASVLRGSNNARSAQNLIDRFEACAARFRNATIECRPAVDVIRRFAVPDAWVYCDPPYVHSTRRGLSKRAGDYAHEMSEDDHRELAVELRATSAGVLLSGYHSDLYDELYDGWHQLEREVVLSSSSGRGGRGQVATEVLWSNRPLETGLFVTTATRYTGT